MGKIAFAVAIGSLVGALALPVAASAMDYTYSVVNGVGVIHAEGDIGAHEAQSFQMWLDANKAEFTSPIKRIEFDSGGGVAEQGIALGEIVKQKGWDTSVAPKGYCASACVVAWDEGKQKYLPYNSSIGVHQPALHCSEECEITVGEIRDFLALNKSGLATLKQAGAPKSVIDAASTTPGTSIHWLTEQELLDWNVKIIVPAA